MLGVCPHCRTAYSWEFPRYGCACGRMSDVPPAVAPASDYTALGRSPFAPGAWWGDRDRDDRTRPTPRPAGGASALARDAEVRNSDWERDREREQRRRERDEERWDRWDRWERDDRGRGRRRWRQ